MPPNAAPQRRVLGRDAAREGPAQVTWGAAGLARIRGRGQHAAPAGVQKAGSWLDKDLDREEEARFRAQHPPVRETVSAPTSARRTSEDEFLDVASSQRRVEAGLARLTTQVSELLREVRAALQPGSPASPAPSTLPRTPRSGWAGAEYEGAESPSLHIQLAQRKPQRMAASASDDFVVRAPSVARPRRPSFSAPVTGTRTSSAALVGQNVSEEEDADAKGSDSGNEKEEEVEDTSRTLRRQSRSAPWVAHLGLGFPANWPACVPMREYGVDVDVDDLNVINHHMQNTETHKSNPFEVAHTDSDAVSPWHSAFAVVAFVVLLHDLTIIPYALAWEIDFTGYLEVTSLISLCFWMTEICVTVSIGQFCSGPSRGLLNHQTIKYLRTWFVLDAGLVTSDLMAIVFESQVADHSTTGLRILRVAKLTRLLRVAGFLRIVRIIHILMEGFEQLSETARVIMTVVAFGVGTLWITHLLACAWFALGKFAVSDTGIHWLDMVTSFQGEEVAFRDVDQGYQYMTSVHWAVQQLAMAGTVDFTATNSMERLFNAVWLIAGMMFGSVLVSSISASMVELHARRRDRDQRLKNMRRYLRHNRVDTTIGIRVIRQVTQRISHAGSMAAGQVQQPQLELLSTGLRLELHTNICRPTLVKHPLLRLWDGIDATWFVRFCSEVVTISFLREADELFRMGSPSTSASVLVEGLMRYTQRPAQFVIRDSDLQEVAPGSWFAEVTLWCDWVHVGTATAVTTSKVLTLNAVRFSEMCRAHRLIGGVALEYCRQFHARVGEAKPPENPWPTDLAVPNTSYPDMVFSMSDAIRRSIGTQVIGMYNFSSHEAAMTRRLRRSLIPESLRLELLKEVLEGASTVVLDANGSLIRMVELSALCLEREDGFVFAQLGKWDGTGVTAACELPGTKCKDGEEAQDTVQRLLDTKLAPIAAQIELLHSETFAKERVSYHFDIVTKYLRTVFHAKLTGEVSPPICTHLHDEGPMVSQPMRSLHVSRFRAWESTSSDCRSLPEDLKEGDVYFMRYEGRGTFYAWLSYRDMEQMESTASKALLEAWLSHLVLPAVPVEHDEMIQI